MAHKLARWMRVGGAFLLLLSSMASGQKMTNEERAGFYMAFSSGDVDKIDQALAVFKPRQGMLARAYEGGLLMKKAHLIKGPGEKLRMFKAGHELLEKEIAAAPDNAELRFIRLCVQENAPKIVKYREDIEEDKAEIIRYFSNFPADIRKFILDYAGSSSVITPDDLK